MHYKIFGVIAILIVFGGGVVFVVQRYSNDLPSCGTQKEFFTSHYVRPSDYDNLDPLGGVSPPDHTFPTDHMYFQREGTTIEPTTLYAPGNVYLTEIRKSINKDDRPTVRPKFDYSLRMKPCQEVTLFVIHINELSDAIEKQIDWNESDCRADLADSYTEQVCTYYSNDIFLAEGDIIGYTGTTNARQSHDIGIIDDRQSKKEYANNSRWNFTHTRNIACPLDYFSENIRAEMAAKIEQIPDRTGFIPLCGRIDQDIAGTASGAWFIKDTTETFPEKRHLSLIQEASNPNLGLFSLSQSFEVYGVKSARYTYHPREEGYINRRFSDVRPGHIYCFEDIADEQYQTGNIANFHILLSMPQEDELTIDVLSGSTCQGGDVMSQEALLFER